MPSRIATNYPFAGYTCIIFTTYTRYEAHRRTYLIARNALFL